MPALASSFTAAVARLDSKSPVASVLSSAEWAEVPLALRERAFFSARINDAKTVQTMQDAIRQALSLENETFMDRSKFMATIRQAIGAEEGDTGDLQDIASRKRLGLIYDQNVEDAQEYGRWQAGNDPDLLDAFPAQELVRIESRETERDWGMRWADAGGTFFGSRMIALKDAPVWTALSRFGKPWPPFDYGSGMGVEDISREEAEQIGLIKPDQQVSPPQKQFNSALQASVQGLSPEVQSVLTDLLGDQAKQLASGVLAFIGGKAGA